MGRILQVDCDGDFLELARLSLEERLGIEVICASGGDEAIRLMQKGNKFDLIVSEYIMPQGTGLDLLKFQILQSSSTPFFFFTHASRLEIPYTPRGFIGVFEKTQFEQLCSSIKHILSQKNR